MPNLHRRFDWHYIQSLGGDFAKKLWHSHKTSTLSNIYIFLLLKTAMELMGIVGVMVNCALIGQSGQVHRMFPNITGTQTILLIIILEVRN